MCLENTALSPHLQPGCQLSAMWTLHCSAAVNNIVCPGFPRSRHLSQTSVGTRTLKGFLHSGPVPATLLRAQVWWWPWVVAVPPGRPVSDCHRSRGDLTLNARTISGATPQVFFPPFKRGMKSHLSQTSEGNSSPPPSPQLSPTT